MLVTWGGYWGFLQAAHPAVLGVVAVTLTVWLLFALVPKITVHAMRFVDLKLPRGDSAVPVVGRIVRVVFVLLGPALLYWALMALRERPSPGAEYAGSALLGLVLGAVGWRTVTLLAIMRETFPEDQVRKGLLDSGTYTREAIRKLEQAGEQILGDGDFDRKRIRLRRLAATDQVLRNKNYDPHREAHGTTKSASLAGLERERDLVWAQRNLDRATLHADLGDEEVRTRLAEQRAKQREFEV